jgi:hypothetical protein
MKKVCKILLLFGAFVAAFSQPFLAAGQSAVSQQAGAVKLPFSLTISYNRTLAFQLGAPLRQAHAQLTERWRRDYETTQTAEKD